MLAAFVVLELGLRLTGTGEIAPSFRRLFIPDDLIGYRLRPGASIRYTETEFDSEIRINESGVRDDREIAAKPPDEYRVLVLGDSMVLAVQVAFDETFTARLEHHLNANASHRSVRVINAGVQGYGPVESYLFLTHYGLTFEPDLVLAVVYAGNDATDAADSEYRLIDATGARSRGPGTVSEPSHGRLSAPLWVRRLSRRSAAAQFVRLRVLAVLGPFLEVPLRDRPMDGYLVDPPPDVTRGFAVVPDAVQGMARIAREAGADTAVVLLPAVFEIDSTRFAAVRDGYQRSDRTLTRHGATERLRDGLATIGVPLLDLLPVFQTAADAKSFYFQQNTHLTARGHAEVARAVARFIDPLTQARVSSARWVVSQFA